MMTLPMLTILISQQMVKKLPILGQEINAVRNDGLSLIQFRTIMLPLPGMRQLVLVVTTHLYVTMRMTFLQLL